MKLQIKLKEKLKKEEKQRNYAKHHTSNNKGITLIALIITIVILLILAVVTISAVQGDGIIEYAKIAKNEWEDASKDEQQALQNLEYNIAGGAPSSTIITANYGDYVDYGLDINNNGKTDDDWKIFYKDSENRIFLIAADYVPSTCKALTDSTAKAKMTQSGQAGQECCYRWESDSVAEYHCNDNHNTSLNNEKNQCSFPEIFMPNEGLCKNGTHYYCSDHVGSNGTDGNANARCASALQCTENWRPFIEESSKRYCADYAIGGPTLEMWVASWNEKHGENSNDDVKKKLYADGNGSYGYNVGAQEGTNDPNATFTSATGYSDELYFPHKGQDNLNLDKSGTADTKNQKCDGYWLASPAGDANNKVMMVFYNGGMKGATITVDRGFRPIVCLKSNVRLTKRENTETEANKVVYDIQMPNV